MASEAVRNQSEHDGESACVVKVSLCDGELNKTCQEGSCSTGGGAHVQWALVQQPSLD